MAYVALALSLFVAAIGALGIVSPPALVRSVRRVQTPAGLYAVGALRVVFGAALYLSAPASRAPGILPVLGVLVFLAGLATLFFGLDRFRRLLDWWAAQGTAFLRAWAIIALGFGAWLAWAVAP